MLDLTEEHRKTVIDACVSLYGNFLNGYILIQGKTRPQICKELIEYIKDEVIDINYYIYILTCQDGCFIKQA